MPTFIFFRNKTKIDSLRGADPNALEEKIKKWYGSGDETAEDLGVKGHVSQVPFSSSLYKLWYENENVQGVRFLQLFLLVLVHGF